MNSASIQVVYKRYARNYNLIFGKIFEQGRRRVIERMNCQPGERILDVGIGTGLSLNFYPEYATVVGVDISPHMLRVAQRQVESLSVNHICLSLMDAQQLSFRDNSFDKVSAMYVASVVPNPKSMIAEMKRVCKRDGDIFILNHFSNSHLLPRLIETVLIPFENVIGFRPRFSLERLIVDTKLNVTSVLPVNFFGFWTLIHAKNIN
ncbi:MAG: methyltransferase domain-containing protein [Desulfobacterales bacterium]|jgi:phosphatidylethanolamine/phosphatidyl-N-methylethanolamine N-methyltransferase|nr:methyltransferase domain-containing protein [Desulfobacterales bacterium]